MYAKRLLYSLFKTTTAKHNNTIKHSEVTSIISTPHILANGRTTTGNNNYNNNKNNGNNNNNNNGTNMNFIDPPACLFDWIRGAPWRLA